MGKKAVSESIKWEIVAFKNENIKSNVQIAKIVGVSETCVRTTYKNYKLTKCVKDLPRSGRPKKTFIRDESFIFRKVREQPTLSLRNLASLYNENPSNKKVNRETIRRILTKKGIRSYYAFRKPLLTVRDMLRRRKWCKER